MKVMVCGSRGWTDAHAIEQRLDALRDHRPSPTFRLIVGTDRKGVGADSIARDWALRRGVTLDEFPPDVTLPSPQRFHVRNDAMLNENPDIVLAFWDGESPGTSSVINKAYKRGIVTEVRIAPLVAGSSSR
jgi:hypothetical protein